MLLHERGKCRELLTLLRWGICHGNVFCWWRLCCGYCPPGVEKRKPVKFKKHKTTNKHIGDTHTLTHIPFIKVNYSSNQCNDTNHSNTGRHNVLWQRRRNAYLGLRSIWNELKMMLYTQQRQTHWVLTQNLPCGSRLSGVVLPCLSLQSQNWIFQLKQKSKSSKGTYHRTFCHTENKQKRIQKGIEEYLGLFSCFLHLKDKTLHPLTATMDW